MNIILFVQENLLCTCQITNKNQYSLVQRSSFVVINVCRYPNNVNYLLQQFIVNYFYNKIPKQLK